tara:strand:+ start:153 stop:857 length:705 start_codon:yes stop_codon:yes gene_type:complete
MKYQLEIIIPVYYEQDNIYETISNILKIIKTNYRLTIVFDFDNDPTLNVIKENFDNNRIFLVKNKYSGLNGAMKTAFEYSESDSVVLYTAEDHQNFDVINQMYEKFKNGYDVVCASRLMLGGDYNKVKEPLIKKILVNIVSFTLKNFTNIGTVDPTNGFRLFSKEIIKKFPIESKKGFTFAIELLAKAYKNNYKITEVPSMSPLRKFGKSKFKNTSIIYYIPWFLKILFTKSKI